MYQEVFDKCVRHLHTQGGQSLGWVNGTITCAYRGKGNRKCAVGVFIPDEKYYRALEGNGVSRDMVTKALQDDMRVEADKSPEFVTFLSELQACHDTAIIKLDTDGEWDLDKRYVCTTIDDLMRIVAARHKLSDAVVTECWGE